MPDIISQIQETFEEWMQFHEYNNDYTFYRHDEWLARGETILKEAELILIFDGNGLVTLLNYYTGDWDIHAELEELAGAFGYYYEMGNHWNLGFYRLEGEDTQPSSNLPYSELLQHPRWKAKRNRIIERCESICENCRTKTMNLEIHHCYYRFGRLPWQYPDAALLALCRSCHLERGAIELRWRGFMPKFSTNELETLRESFRKNLYWFDRSRLFQFLSNIHKHDIDQHQLLDELLASHGHHELDRQGKMV